MGYFNYFIKCIIRKFVNTIFNPKGLLLIFLIIFLLYFFCGTARAEWTDDDILYFYESVATITGNQGVMISQLIDMGVDVTDIENKLNIVSEDIAGIRTQTTVIRTKVLEIVNQLNTISSSITNIYNKLDENQQQLLTELEKDNEAVLNELNMIRDAINGSEEESTIYSDLGIIRSSANSYNYRLKCISIDYEARYTYKVRLHISNTGSATRNMSAYTSNNLIPSNFDETEYYSLFSRIGQVPPGYEDYIIDFEVPTTNPRYLYFTFGEFITKIEVFREIKGIVESLNQSNSLQQQQNQLQQEQNQLQQEQNNFLQQGTSDSDVSVDSFNNVDSNDITSVGLTGVFNNIYSSITSWKAKNINLPIPYTNKTITIPANYTENMLSSFGGNWIITFIHSIYYFIVARFMIYSITDIINSIKSGSILNTDSKNNITTDML